MKLTTGILAVVMMTGAAWGQNPDAIDNARSVAKSLQQIKTNETNAALDAAGLGIDAVVPSPLRGADGNVEFVAHARRGRATVSPDALDHAVERAHGEEDAR